VRQPSSGRARVYQQLRSAHLERAHEQVPATIFYRTHRYDFDPSLGAGLDLKQGRLPSLVWSILVSRISTMEVNEPLMRTGILRTAIAVATVRAAARVRRESVSVVSYAIENSDPFGQGAPTRLKSRLRYYGERSLSAFIAGRTDRIAYGTDGAADVYGSRLTRQLERTSSKVIPAVPAACQCADVAGRAERDPQRVVFIGALQPRKGFPQLLAAWPHVIALDPEARLTIIGTGALEKAAREFAENQNTVELLVDPPRSEIHRRLRQASILVLLSQPSPTWREQVGLPIVEALSHGCSVVTSTETGLAGWLLAHGHVVISPDTPEAKVAEYIVQTIADGRTAESVVADLPSLDGRLNADQWLFDSQADPT
jgi:glycosyltransferase involved in cell wall biosynthesis